MSLLDRLRGRRSDPATPAPQPPPVDDGLDRWVDAAEHECAGLGPAGRVVVAVLGESLLHPPTSPWFGHEPTTDGLARLLSAVGEDPAAAAPLAAAESPLAGRRTGVPSAAALARWRAVVDAALGDPAASAALPDRDDVHLEAERVWRVAAAAVQPWRAVQLDPDRALGQVRWFPGCTTRASIGYADPLGVASVQRAVEEHRFSEEEWQALLPAADLAGRTVDPLAWRLSSLTFAVADRAPDAAHDGAHDG